MQYVIRSCQGGTDYLFIVDVAFYKIYQPVNLLKILTLSGRKIINNSNMVAKFDEMVSQIGANKTRAACDDYSLRFQ